MCEVTDEIKFHVPPQYFEAVSCFCCIRANAYEGSSDLLVVGTLNGQIIEFSCKKVLNACEIKRNCKTESILFFASYNPFIIYYVVKFGSEVYIVTRDKTLKVFRSYNKVKKIAINDFSSVGSPQLGIWFLNKPLLDLPHLVTDFSSKDSDQSESSSALCDEFSELYQKRLQEIRLKSCQLEKDLATKQQFRFKCTQELMKNQLEECLPHEELICILGERKVSSSLQQKRACSRLELRKIWQKVHNEKWIIGVQVVNKGESPVINPQLLLKAAEKNTTSCTCFYSKRRPESDSYSPLTIEWESPLALCTDVLVTAAATFPLSSHLLESDLILHGVILYKMEGDAAADFQLPLPPILFDDDAFARGAYSLFLSLPAVMEEDVLSILVSSVSFKLHTSHSVADVLMKEYGFSQLSEFGKFYNSNRSSPLYGMLLEFWLESGHYHLLIHSKDLAQALSLIRPLKVKFPSDSEIVDLKADKRIDSQEMYKALEAEIDLTSNWLLQLERNVDSGKDEICATKNAYLEFRSSLSKLELKTDELEVQKSLIRL